MPITTSLFLCVILQRMMKRGIDSYFSRIPKKQAAAVRPGPLMTHRYLFDWVTARSLWDGMFEIALHMDDHQKAAERGGNCGKIADSRSQLVTQALHTNLPVPLRIVGTLSAAFSDVFGQFY